MAIVSTRGLYGLQALIELASSQQGQPVQVGAIAESQGISRKYLHNLMAVLKRAGLVRSLRGAKGGYVLARAADAIVLREVLEALEGGVSVLGDAKRVEDPADSGRAAVVEVLQEVDTALLEILGGYTIDELARRRARREGQQMYFI